MSDLVRPPRSHLCYSQTLRVTVTIGLAAAVITGCAALGPDDRPAVARVAKSALEAKSRGDLAAYCSYLAPDNVALAQGQAGCPGVIALSLTTTGGAGATGAAKVVTIDLDEVTVEGDSAEIDGYGIHDGDPYEASTPALQLVRRAGIWYLR